MNLGIRTHRHPGCPRVSGSRLLPGGEYPTDNDTSPRGKLVIPGRTANEQLPFSLIYYSSRRFISCFNLTWIRLNSRAMGGDPQSGKRNAQPLWTIGNCFNGRSLPGQCSSPGAVCTPIHRDFCPDWQKLQRFAFFGKSGGGFLLLFVQLGYTGTAAGFLKLGQPLCPIFVHGEMLKLLQTTARTGHHGPRDYISRWRTHRSPPNEASRSNEPSHPIGNYSVLTGVRWMNKN